MEEDKSAVMRAAIERKRAARALAKSAVVPPPITTVTPPAIDTPKVDSAADSSKAAVSEKPDAPLPKEQLTESSKKTDTSHKRPRSEAGKEDQPMIKQQRVKSPPITAPTATGDVKTGDPLKKRPQIPSLKKAGCEGISSADKEKGELIPSGATKEPPTVKTTARTPAEVLAGELTQKTTPAESSVKGSENSSMIPEDPKAVIHLDTPEKVVSSSEVPAVDPSLPAAADLVSTRGKVPSPEADKPMEDQVLSHEIIKSAEDKVPNLEADKVAEEEPIDINQPLPAGIAIDSSKRIEKLPVRRKLVVDTPDTIADVRVTLVAGERSLPVEVPTTGTDTRVPEESALEEQMTGEASLHDEVLRDEGIDLDSSSDYEFNEEYAGNLDKVVRFNDKTGGVIVPTEGPGATGEATAEDHGGQILQPGGSGKELETVGNLDDVNLSH